MRYPSCLTVAPSTMDATIGGSGGIKPDPSLETGRDGEKNLKSWRKKIIRIQETERGWSKSKKKRK